MKKDTCRRLLIWDLSDVCIIFRQSWNILMKLLLRQCTGWTPSLWTMASCTVSRTSSNSLSHGETTTRASASTRTRTNGRRRTPATPRARRRSRSRTAISDFPSPPPQSSPIHRYWILVEFMGGSRRRFEGNCSSRKYIVGWISATLEETEYLLRFWRTPHER